jgi:hypothetical protein
MAYEKRPTPTPMGTENPNVVNVRIDNLPYAGETHKLCQIYHAQGFELKQEEFGWIASMSRERFEARTRACQQKSLDVLKVQQKLDVGEGLTSSVAIEKARQEELEAILGAGA